MRRPATPVLGAELGVAADGALAVALMVSAVLTLGTSRPWAALVAAAWMSAVAWRSTAPAAMALVASLGAIGYSFVPAAPATPLWAFITVLLVAYGVAAGLDGRRAAAWLALLFVSGAFLGAAAKDDPDPLVQRLLTLVVVVGAPATAGRLVRHSRQQAAQLRRLGDELASEREAHATIAAAQERNRIAGDLDDVITRSVGAMVACAARAERLLRQDDPAREPLGVVGETGRVALQDLALQLRSLGREAQRPVPGLADAVSLARQAGAHVVHDPTSPAREVPTGTGLAAYRVVQESLTNARKHAQGAEVRVLIAQDGGDLVVEVVNDGGVTWPESEAGGHGLAGMRERVSLYAGEVEAGPTGDGGWRTRAVFPVVDDGASLERAG